MKHILIPTDFSENAWNALKYGLELFKKTRCTFYLVHINPIPPYSGAGTSVRAAADNFKEGILRESKKGLRLLMDRIEKYMPLNTKHNFVPLAFYDFFVDTIRRESQTRKIDLIIMGTKGAPRGHQGGNRAKKGDLRKQHRRCDHQSKVSLVGYSRRCPIHAFQGNRLSHGLSNRL